MVLYDTSGRAIQAHEDYLEREAHKDANEHKYDEQIDICNRKKETASKNPVRIIIEKQVFKTLYCEKNNHWGSRWEYLDTFEHAAVEKIPVRVDRKILMQVSTLAQEHFDYNPRCDELHLPVRYPRKHERPLKEPHYYEVGEHMAYIRGDEIKEYVLPWLREMQTYFQDMKIAAEKEQPEPEAPRINIPEDLLGKIHLYNAMLQLGLPNYAQLPLIDALVLHMYQSNLKSCHLDALEMTVGRFNSHGIAILDPVMNHFIGTYSFRSAKERKEVTGEPFSTRGAGDEIESDILVGCEPTDFRETPRDYLRYTEMKAGRIEFPDDTFILPPQLPVIGHSIRNWSNIRRNGSVAAAHTGFPLNIGMTKKYYQWINAAGDKVEEVAGEDTHRLRSQDYYKNFRPGNEEDDGGPEEEGEKGEVDPIDLTGMDDPIDLTGEESESIPSDLSPLSDEMDTD